MPQDTNEQLAGYIRALLEERAGAEARGKDARVEAIDAELSRVGHKGKAPAQRAEKRSASQEGAEE